VSEREKEKDEKTWQTKTYNNNINDQYQVTISTINQWQTYLVAIVPQCPNFEQHNVCAGQIPFPGSPCPHVPTISGSTGGNLPVVTGASTGSCVTGVGAGAGVGEGTVGAIGAVGVGSPSMVISAQLTKISGVIAAPSSTSKSKIVKPIIC
jgi:hypothetical protein